METSYSQKAIPADLAYRNRYKVLAVILIGTFMAMLDATMVSIGLPTITKGFGVDIVQSQWTITGYLLAMTGLFIFFGKVSEFTGKVSIFIAGWLIFGVSSLACGLAPGLNELIAFRVVQGIGASMVSCVGMALIYLAFPPRERGKAMGLFGLVFGCAALVGPGLGGLIVDHFGWQYMFFINVPLCVLLLAMAFRYMKIPETRSRRLEMDWIGAVTLFLAIVSLMLLCTEIAKGLEVTGIMAAYAAVFVVSAMAFFAYELRCARPLLDLSLFRNSRYTMPIVSSVLLFAGISMANTLAPFFFQGAMGYTASDVGYISMVVPLFMMFASPAAGAWYDRRHGRFQAAAGLAVCCLGMLVTALGILALDFWIIILGFALRGVGSGLFSSPNSIETLVTIPKEKLALASSVVSTANYMAMMLGVAFCTILVTANLNDNGYYGPVILSGPSLLSGSVGIAILVSAALCAIAAIAAALRNVGRAAGTETEKPTSIA